MIGTVWRTISMSPKSYLKTVLVIEKRTVRMRGEVRKEERKDPSPSGV